MIPGPVNHFDSSAFLYKDDLSQIEIQIIELFEMNRAPEELVASIKLSVNISCNIFRRDYRVVQY